MQSYIRPLVWSISFGPLDQLQSRWRELEGSAALPTHEFLRRFFYLAAGILPCWRSSDHVDVSGRSGAWPMNPTCPTSVGGTRVAMGMLRLESWERAGLVIRNSLRLNAVLEPAVAEWILPDGRTLRLYALGRGDRASKEIRTAAWTADVTTVIRPAVRTPGGQ